MIPSIGYALAHDGIKPARDLERKYDSTKNPTSGGVLQIHLFCSTSFRYSPVAA